jgi:hypothetical protein
MNEKIIQIAFDHYSDGYFGEGGDLRSNLFALTDKGRIFMLEDNTWANVPLPELPNEK